jgi:hypothetical protein
MRDWWPRDQWPDHAKAERYGCVLLGNGAPIRTCQTGSSLYDSMKLVAEANANSGRYHRSQERRFKLAAKAWNDHIGDYLRDYRAHERVKYQGQLAAFQARQVARRSTWWGRLRNWFELPPKLPPEEK